MDETDNTSVKSPEILAAEAARMAADRLRAQARAEFQTPSWIGPARTEGHEVPTQPEPEHDDLAPLPPVAMPSNPIPDEAHWVEKARPRLAAGTVLVVALAGVLGFLVVAVVTQSVAAIAGLVACAVVAVLFRGALMGEGITKVDLKGSVLRIRTGGVLDIVNLADPMHFVQLIGTPDQPTWRVYIQAVDGRGVELGPRQVDAAELHRIVTYYRAIADRAKAERERRFNR